MAIGSNHEYKCEVSTDDHPLKSSLITLLSEEHFADWRLHEYLLRVCLLNL